MSSTSRLHPGANTAKMACPPQYEYFALLRAGSSAGGFPVGRDEDEEKPELGEKVHRSLLKEIEATSVVKPAQALRSIRKCRCAREMLSLSALRCMAARPLRMGSARAGLTALIDCAAWVIGPAGEARADECDHGATGRMRL
jgi:hypothetical protein